MGDIDSFKQDLIDAITMLERQGIVDFNGHASIRLDDGRILINSGASTRSALTPEDISVIDSDGDLLDGAKPPMELHIHTEIYRRRPDVGAVVHAHPKWSTLLTSTGTAVRPVFAQGCLVSDLPVLDDPLSMNSAERCVKLAERLDKKRGILLRCHGTVLVGADIVEAFVHAVYLEQNCQRQYEASLIGEPYVFTKAEVAACEANLNKRALFRKCWDYYHAKQG